MGWLETLLFKDYAGPSGVNVTRRKDVQFHGGVEVFDDPANKRTVVRVGSPGFDFKESVRVATTAALAANTRTGNVLTASANGALGAVDSVSLGPGDSLLVKNEAAGENNGFYTVTQLGDGSTPWILTRREDFDASDEVKAGLLVAVEEGSTNADTLWILATNNPIVLNSTALSFTKLAPSAGGGGGGYDTIQEDGSGLNQRAILNFVGAGITAADDAGNSRTNVTVPLGAGLTLPVNPTDDGKIYRANAGNGEWLAGSAAGQALIWNGSQWQAAALDLADADATVNDLAVSKLADSAAVRSVLWSDAGTPQWTSAPTLDRLAFGASPATTGTVRMAHGDSLYGLASVGGANNRALATWGVDATDVLAVGDDLNAGVSYRAGNTGTAHRFYLDNTHHLTVGENAIEFPQASGGAGFIRAGAPWIGATISGTDYNTWLYGEPSAWNSADVTLFLSDATAQPTAVDANGAFLWAWGSSQLRTHRFLATEYLAVLTGTLPASGTLRFAGIAASVTARDSGNTDDRTLLDWASDVLTVGNSSSETVLPGDVTIDCVKWVKGAETTTDATVTTLASIAPGNSKAGRVAVVVTAKSGTTTNIYSIQQSFETDGSGNVTLRGSLTVVSEDEDDADWSVTLDASTTSLRVRVTGEAATTIDWRCAGQAMVA